MVNRSGGGHRSSERFRVDAWDPATAQQPSPAARRFEHYFEQQSHAGGERTRERVEQNAHSHRLEHSCVLCCPSCCRQARRGELGHEQRPSEPGLALELALEHARRNLEAVARVE